MFYVGAKREYRHRRRQDGGGSWFVYKDGNNILYVEQSSEEKLYSRGLMCEVNWIPKVKESEFLCATKVRYRQPERNVGKN